MMRRILSAQVTVPVVVLTLVLSLSAWVSGAQALSLLPQSEVEHVFPHYTFDIDLNYNYHSLDAVEQVVVPNPAGVTLSDLLVPR